MAGLSKKDLRAVLKSLEAQGCTLRPVSNGTWVGFPNGKSTTFHRTESDHRSALNQRARVKAAGLTWPFDNEDNSKKEPDMGRTPDKNIEKNVREAIELLVSDTGASVFSTEQIAELAGENAPSTRRAMIRLGYRSLGHRKGWAHESTFAPEPVEEPAIEVPAPYLMTATESALTEALTVQPRPITSKPQREAKVVDMSLIPAEMLVADLSLAYQAIGYRMDIVLRRIDN